LDKEAPEPLAGEHSCESGEDGPICRLERRSMAPEDRYLVAEQVSDRLSDDILHRLR
jgi:hypothetical protein